MSAITITLNGKPAELAQGTTVAQLVATSGALPDRVAVERNGEVVPRRNYLEIELADGDRVEVVTFVGGG